MRISDWSSDVCSSDLIDRHRLDAELAAGLDDAAGDFAAIGNQDLVEQLLGHDALYLHSGMLSCFFHGFSSFLSRSMARRCAASGLWLPRRRPEEIGRAHV